MATFEVSRRRNRTAGLSGQYQSAVAGAHCVGPGDSAYTRLAEIKRPVFVANGNNDVMVPTINSFTMRSFCRMPS